MKINKFSYANGEKVQIVEEAVHDEYDEINDRLDGDLERIVSKRLSTEKADVVWKTVLSFAALMREHKNPLLTLDAICFAAGMFVEDNMTVTQLAAKHGVTKQALSKRIVAISEKLNLPPVNGMKSKAARESYSRAHTSKKKK
jgi:hypothetical protein